MTKNEKAAKTDLDRINNERVAATEKRVAQAIRLLSPQVTVLDCKAFDRFKPKDIAKAIGLLETGAEDLAFACEHFNWNTDVCFLINEAIADLGTGLAEALNPEAEPDYELEVMCPLMDGRVKLAKALGALVTWFDGP